MRFLIAALLISVPAVAGEFALLESGAQIRIERYEKVGDTIRLYTTADAFLEIPASMVTGFEPEVKSTPPPQVAQPAPIAPAETAKVEKPKPNPRDLIDKAALAHGVPAEFVHLVARAESGYKQEAVSSKGAIGIMQLMPQTAAALNADPYDPEQNVEAGTRLLRDLLVQYKDQPDQLRRALAAYNAGPGAVAKYNGVPPYRETQLYVDKIVEGYRQVLNKSDAKR